MSGWCSRPKLLPQCREGCPACHEAQCQREGPGGIEEARKAVVRAFARLLVMLRIELNKRECSFPPKNQGLPGHRSRMLELALLCRINDLCWKHGPDPSDQLSMDMNASPKRSVPSRAVLLSVLVLLSGLSFLVDLHLTRKYGGVDLRDKIVAARSLLAGHKLYEDPWRPGEDERLLDPMVPVGSPITRYTGTPFQALVLAPLGMLPFKTLHLAWLVVQYALLFLIALMMYRSFPPSDAHAASMVLLLLLVMGSTSWHLHVERGQVYIIFAALIAGLFMSLLKGRDLLFGVFGAALILFKPTYGILLLPLVLRTTARMWMGAGLLLAPVALAFLFLPRGMQPWPEYIASMDGWAAQVLEGEPVISDPHAYVYPAIIEGSSNLTAFHSMEFENSSITSILYNWNFPLPTWLPGAGFGVFLIMVVVAFGRGLLKADRSDLLLLGFCCWTVLMILLPVPRFDYQVVQWAGPLAYVLLRYPHRPVTWNTLALVAAAMLLGAWSILPVNILIAEVIMLGLIMWTLLYRIREKQVPT